jgi:hypothetical protein
LGRIFCGIKPKDAAKNPRLSGVQTFGLNAVCRVKNRLKPIFWGLMRETQQTASGLIRLKPGIWRKTREKNFYCGSRRRIGVWCIPGALEPNVRLWLIFFLVV